MTINKKNNHTKNGYRYFRSLVIPAALVMIGGFTGCNKFLDVAPKDKVPQSTLFTTEQGFKDALTGVYVGMDKNSTAGARFGLYTNDLTMGMVSVMGVDYDNFSNSTVQDGIINNVGYYYYNQSSVKLEIDGIWGGLYNNIANLNNILTEIEGRKDVFTGDSYNRVKGEALALRALFHFDLARLFGKSPATGMNDKAIPYNTKYGINPSSFNTLQEVLDACIGDLTAAKDLLAETDTSAVLKGAEDPFHAYTQNHLNYWAVQGLMARVYLYKGDLENADKYARAVIGAGKFKLITFNVALNTDKDRTFSQELLFALYSSSVKANNITLFGSTKEKFPLNLDPETKRKALYVATSGSANDYRYTSWFENNTATPAVNVPCKYFQDDGMPYYLQNMVPLIRVSEMYYIAAECANRKNDITTSVNYLNEVRQSRSVYPLIAAGITSTDSVSNEIMREYQKEFIQEGQTFFYYKRLNKNLRQVTGTTAPEAQLAGAYNWPIPDQEKEYNNP
ncbi:MULTISPECIES: RagB/SusD family nutrient uptake outer membrane protein [Niastella]|uniref:RagB/SusD family nutrient uptake outer membrane protein n=1 Tax=Niastella soli TaxID=2821487 RepID=A0ABS3Z3G6_9BACT|nr:RagB/SusD family nutrient uptake outer membrane protein [Niastella soli]MBO9204704.1 RagB/SusD family nutrient uptake outer membrane protein [Niastella soli]